MAADKICLGVITGAHGVKGRLKVKSFTDDPADIGAYGSLTDETGERVFEVDVTGHSGQSLIVSLSGVRGRDAATALKGMKLFAPRAVLPEAGPDEYYDADLVGLAVEGIAGEPMGTVKALHNFGAGNIIEVQPESGPSVMLPFNRAGVPEIDIAGGRVVVDPPPGLLSGGAPETGEDTPETGEAT